MQPPDAAPSALDILWPQFELLSHSDEPPERCERCRPKQPGVYALVFDGEIVYVGASRDVPARVYAHHVNMACSNEIRRKVFGLAIWMPLPWSVARAYEGALIRELRPSYNVSPGMPSAGHDDEILFGLGLRDSLDVDAVQWEAV